MKKIIFLIVLITTSITSYGQYRWEVSGGAIFSDVNLEDVETSLGTGFYLNAGYEYLLDSRAKTSIVFSIELLQRSSDIEVPTVSSFPFSVDGDLTFKALQVGFSPKFRYLFNRGKDRFRPFINVGPALRLNTKVELGDLELETEEFEQLIISGVYGVGFSQMIGEKFDIFGEFGVTNDFIDNISDVNSKFFDIYARVGVRFRIYDARR